MTNTPPGGDGAAHAAHTVGPEELERTLGVAVGALLRRAAALADARGAALHLVGGAVRDLLLGLPSTDIDLVTEGDAVALAGALAAELGGTVQAHPQFGTATVDLPPLLLDVVTARAEDYPRPGALPEVRPAPLREDLLRRDFTVNTLALALGPAAFGSIADVCGGREDLAAGVLRVLHPRSFLDDPTRVLRGARIASRLGMTPEPHTRALIAEAVAAGAFAAVTPQRLAAEVCLALREPAPERVAALLDEWGALQALHPGLRWTPVLAQAFARARATVPAEALADVYLGLMAYPLTPAERHELADRYRPPTPQLRLLRDLAAVRERAAGLLAEELADSAVDRALRGVGEAALRAAQLLEPAPAAGRIGRYLDVLRGVQVAVGGEDLKRLGVPPGPRYREILAQLRADVLDGHLTTRAEQEAWVRENVGMRDEG